MARTHTTLLVSLTVGLMAALGATAFWLSRGEVELETSAAPAPGPASGAAHPEPSLESAPAQDPSGLAVAPGTSGPAGTTVAWPVKVELELIRAAHLPKANGAAPMRTGATARLRGRIQRGEAGIAAKVVFTSGPNAGRELICNELGEFGAIDLYPGLAEVRVEGQGLQSFREVRLRREQVEELNISYDLPGVVYGSVFDRDGKPVEGVDVELDGAHVLTDAEGIFHYSAATAGDAVELVLRKAGFATESSLVAVAAGRTIEKGRYTFTLHPAAKLEVSLGPRVGSKEDALVILLPEISEGQHTYPGNSYPWHRVSPARVRPGTSLVLDDLPPMRINVRVFHDGATAEPEVTTVFLQPGQTAQHAVRFEPAPSLHGVVLTTDGRRVENARVTCEAPDRTGATLQYLGEMPRILETEILPTFPPAASEAHTNFNGEFQLSTWPRFGGTRYLWAESPDGKLWGGRAIGAKDTQVELVIAPIEGGRASLALEFPGRNQGLPVVVSVGGQPREEVIVAADEPLVVEGLATGTWRVRASWNGRSLLPVPYEELELEGDESKSFDLPQGALTGQDADTLLRAGRPVPTSALPPPPSSTEH